MASSSLAADAHDVRRAAADLLLRHKHVGGARDLHLRRGGFQRLNRARHPGARSFGSVIELEGEHVDADACYGRAAQTKGRVLAVVRVRRHPLTRLK